MKLISFTLYGSDPKYTRGLFENLELKDDLYPDWDVIVYHDNSVPKETLDILESCDTILKNEEDSGILAASWRFLAHDENCERFICRDADSRFSQREVDAVNEWIEEGKVLHIMRDHLHHGYPMLGGMWGAKVDGVWPYNMRDSILSHQRCKYSGNTNERSKWWMKDMDFLRDVVYPKFAHPELSTIHSARDFMHLVDWGCEKWSKDFPQARNENKNFVGEVFTYENGSLERGPQYKELP